MPLHTTSTANRYLSQLHKYLQVSVQYLNRPGTTIATDQNENMASQGHSWPNKRRKKEKSLTEEVGKYDFKMTDTYGYHIIQCFQVRTGLPNSKFVNIFGIFETNLVNILRTVPNLL